MTFGIVCNELGSSVEVMRVREYGQSFIPNRSKIRPVPEAFELSDIDKEDVVPLLSVWETAKTTLEQGKAIRGFNGPATFCLGFAITVAQILSAAAQYIPARKVAVISDPLDGPESLMPGADGHAGILGINRRSGDVRGPYRAFRASLANMCRIIYK